MNLKKIIIFKKTPASKQPEQEKNHRYGDNLEGYQLGGGRERMGEKVQGLSSINWQEQNRQEYVKNG